MGSARIGHDFGSRDPRVTHVTDRLKATLHNCATQGPLGQNRIGAPDLQAHLAGRIAQLAAIHPARGHRLKLIYDRIAW